MASSILLIDINANHSDDDRSPGCDWAAYAGALNDGGAGGGGGSDPAPLAATAASLAAAAAQAAVSAPGNGDPPAGKSGSGRKKRAPTVRVSQRKVIGELEVLVSRGALGGLLGGGASPGGGVPTTGKCNL